MLEKKVKFIKKHEFILMRCEKQTLGVLNNTCTTQSQLLHSKFFCVHKLIHTPTSCFIFASGEGAQCLQNYMQVIQYMQQYNLTFEQ